jgi:hypothetical protein
LFIYQPLSRIVFLAYSVEQVNNKPYKVSKGFERAYRAIGRHEAHTEQHERKGYNQYARHLNKKLEQREKEFERVVKVISKPRVKPLKLAGSFVFVHEVSSFAFNAACTSARHFSGTSLRVFNPRLIKSTYIFIMSTSRR